MRLYTTAHGLAREEGGALALLDAPERDLGAALRNGSFEALRAAPVRGRVALGEAPLLAPVLRPGKVVIVGLNYRSHAEEVIELLRKAGRAIDLPKDPNFHLTPGSAVIGPDAPIPLPPAAPAMVDYEGEIAAVIGRRATRVDAADAWSHVAGLTICNDVSARDVQRRAMSGDPTVSVGLAKSFDGFKPLGPCLVTADEFAEPLDLRLRTLVNGEVRQDARTTEFLHQISELVAYVSTFMTLEAGDVLSTGSPQGVGQFQGLFLAPGDRVEIEVERIGTLANGVQAV